MPTYVYSCKQCNVQYEIFNKVDDYNKQCCTKCDAISTIVIQPVHFAFSSTNRNGQWCGDAMKEIAKFTPKNTNKVTFYKK